MGIREGFIYRLSDIVVQLYIRKDYHILQDV